MLRHPSSLVGRLPPINSALDAGLVGVKGRVCRGDAAKMRNGVRKDLSVPTIGEFKGHGRSQARRDVGALG
jgi:hypothetical protein